MISSGKYVSSTTHQYRLDGIRTKDLLPEGAQAEYLICATCSEWDAFYSSEIILSYTPATYHDSQESIITSENGILKSGDGFVTFSFEIVNGSVLLHVAPHTASTTLIKFKRQIV